MENTDAIKNGMEDVMNALEEYFLCRHDLTFETYQKGMSAIPNAIALIQQLQAENTELRENIMWMEAERDDFKRTIRQLKAERDTAVKALTVTRDKVEQAHNMLIDDIVHRVDDDTYLVLSNMVGNMLAWPVEDDEHSTQQEED